MLQLVIVFDDGTQRFVRVLVVLEDEFVVRDRVVVVIGLTVGRTVRGGDTVASRFAVQTYRSVFHSTGGLGGRVARAVPHGGRIEVA